MRGVFIICTYLGPKACSQVANILHFSIGYWLRVGGTSTAVYIIYIRQNNAILGVTDGTQQQGYDKWTRLWQKIENVQNDVYNKSLFYDIFVVLP